ncbi:hypothetical protein APUTEX25_004029 [Auxenochlorella protothecoides]|uniref:Enkurin domain-containing protein n=1 Tax=Auxenochlorella protothecoides TaxID=3075 RepID=A0A3M7L592_AUXPR|nr:hypothetical protein APUTEX25_004029 [Auxenochlorella protothecoides]|eukprot:RMZ57195.1 hypothetical protein APUTEX25_004029 [Auxenochlorella protothecoides]
MSDLSWMDYLNKPDFGRVPAYLHERRMEAEARARAAAAAESAQAAQRHHDASSRVLELDGKEVATLLQHVTAKRQVTQAAYMRLPCVVETPSLLRTKQALEDELSALEADLKLLSQAQRIRVE